MNIQVATICDYAKEYCGKLFITGAYDTIEAEQFPLLIPECYYVFQISWTENESGVHTVKAVFTNERGEKTLNDMELSINIGVAAGRKIAASSHIIKFKDLRFSKAGIYNAAIMVDDSSVGIIHLQIVPKTHTPNPSLLN